MQPDVDLGRERSVNWTFGGDLHQLRVLFWSQCTGEFHFDIDSIEHASLVSHSSQSAA